MVKIELDTLDEWNLRHLVNELKKVKNNLTPHVILCREAAEKTTLPQLRYYWGVVLEDIADQTGYYPDEIHDFNKKLFGLKSSYFIGDEAMELIKGLSKMNKKQASDFIDRVINHWTSHGVIIREAQQLTDEDVLTALASEVDSD